MTQSNKTEKLSAKLLAACERISKQENKRTAKGELKLYTSYRLAKAAKIDTGHAYRVLHGQSLPSRDILMRICKALGCSHQEAVEIFSQTDYRIPTPEELEEELSSCAA